MFTQFAMFPTNFTPKQSFIILKVYFVADCFWNTVYAHVIVFFFLLEIRTEFLLEITFYWYETFKAWLLPDDEYYKWLYIKLILSTNFISWRISKL